MARQLQKSHQPDYRRAPSIEHWNTGVKRMLDSVWSTKHKTALAARGYVESVLDWAKTSGLRTGDDSVRWEGRLEHLMTTADRTSQHRPVLEWQAMPAFVAKVRGTTGNLARLMEFIVVTGVRAGEASGATWGEIDCAAKVWRIPAERMKGSIKAKNAHDVPLSDAALCVLDQVTGERTEEALVFPSKKNKAHWDADLSALLRKLGYPKGTVTRHGMRSSLRTFLTEREKAVEDVAESVLAHDKRNRVRKAYERTRHFEARGPLMQAWATYLEPEAVAMPLAA